MPVNREKTRVCAILNFALILGVYLVVREVKKRA